MRITVYESVEALLQNELHTMNNFTAYFTASTRLTFTNLSWVKTNLADICKNARAALCLKLVLSTVVSAANQHVLNLHL